VWFTNVAGAYKLHLSNRDVNFLIQAISTRNPVNILSSPRILTLDNQEAQVTVVREYPFISSQVMSTSGTTTTTYTYKDMGIILTVTPQINPDKFVRLTLKQTVTRYAGVAEGSLLPIYDKRETEGSMLIKDGQTLIMGGMIQENVTDTFTKVPFLGSIPVLGFLFRRKEHTRTRTELMIFVTPYVITSPAEGKKMTEKQTAVLATPPPEDLRLKERTPVSKDLKGMKGERWWRKRRREQKKPVKVEEEKIEIPELEEAVIPEIEEKKKE
ncbi:MAG TPA: type II and III secretion system protein, partial [bacterium]|nr:type II and III secretion system protein [bacterium]